METNATTGPETGGETDADTSSMDTGVDGWNCGMHVLETLDEDCEGLGTAREVLSQGGSARTSELQWSDYASEDITHEPATGTTDVTVMLRYEGGEAVCHHYCDPCPGLPCGAAGEEARIEIEAIAQVSTTDGALAEEVETLVSRVGYGTASSFTSTIPVGDLGGTLAVELLNPDYALLELSITGILTDDVISGGISAVARNDDPTGPQVTVPVATWPAQ